MTFYMRVSAPGLIKKWRKKEHHLLPIRELYKSVNTSSFFVFIDHKAAADRTGEETCKGFEKTSGKFSIHFCTF